MSCNLSGNVAFFEGRISPRVGMSCNFSTKAFLFVVRMYQSPRGDELQLSSQSKHVMVTYQSPRGDELQRRYTTKMNSKEYGISPRVGMSCN